MRKTRIIYSSKMFTHTLFIVCVLCGFAESQDSLQLVHVIFRHGDRTPDRISLYPNDPHLNDTYHPYGLGALTKRGQRQEYALGKSLRRRYDNFLGKIYTPAVLDAWSTDTNRTKMSLQLVLAGLWPPPPSQVWDAQLPWLPIPFNYKPHHLDDFLGYPIMFCDEFITEFENALQLEEFEGFITKNSDLIQYINDHSGLNTKNVFDLFVLYFGLYAEEQNDRALPTWTQKVYPEFLETAAKLAYQMQTHSDKMKQFSGGKMVQRIINDAKLKMNGNLTPEDRKIFLFSGHEYNIAFILSSLNIFKPHVPPYASHIIVELHKIEDVFGFKIFYQDNKKRLPELMTIPGCNSFCPFDTFVQLTANVMPNNESCYINVTV